MKSFAHRPRAALYLSLPVLLFSLAGCGLKGPLYLPDGQPEAVPAGTERPKPVLEGSKIRTLPPAPQSQKKDRERTQANPSQQPSQSQPTPVSPPDPDRPATTPPGQ
jgi:predicted small lipoprotein YifL